MAQYHLEYGNASATVNTLGGELSSYIPENGKETIWCGDPSVWAAHTPVLFPIVGSLVDGKINIQGEEYSIPKHGPARKMEFTLGRHGKDFVEMELCATPETLAMYPFNFRLTIRHTIAADGFSTDFIVDNLSDKDMPVCIGGHPGFVCPMQEGERFEDYVLKFEKPEDGINTLAPNGYIITGEETLEELKGSDTLSLKYAYFDERDALIFAKPASRSVKIVHKNTGRGLLFSFPRFNALGVWTAPNKNAPYLCLEPWNGLPALEGETGNFEDKPYVQILKPGESYLTGYSMQVID